jgi:quercetin dioxygenase-like cupin family protein
MNVHRIVESLPWLPYPTAEGVKVKPMISKKEHGLNVTCMLVYVPTGKDVPEHIHAKQDDILYPLQGKAVMWVDGTGEFTLEPGVIVRVPAGAKHKIENVSKDLLIYDVFCPEFF